MPLRTEHINIKASRGRRVFKSIKYPEIPLSIDDIYITTSDGDTLPGGGFESDADLEEWRIFRPFGIVREGI